MILQPNPRQGCIFQPFWWLLVDMNITPNCWPISTRINALHCCRTNGWLDKYMKDLDVRSIIIGLEGITLSSFCISHLPQVKLKFLMLSNVLIASPYSKANWCFPKLRTAYSGYGAVVFPGVINTSREPQLIQ